MQTPALLPNERLDEVNHGIRLIQNTDGLTYGTDALLLAAYLPTTPIPAAAEFGGGSGIISLLALTTRQIAHIDCIEVQPSYATLISRNAALNALSERLTTHAADIRDYAAKGERCGKMDVVFANPPYMVPSGAQNRTPEKQAARHEVFGGIADFANAAARLLRFGGRFFCVFRPDRLIDLLCALRENKLEPKRMTFVHADEKTPPSMVLVESLAGGKSGLRMTPPLFIYQNHTDYPRAHSEEMETILESGVFPAAYQ